MLTQKQILKEGLEDYQMPFMKIQAFFDEFPWVRKQIGNSPVRKVYVSVAEPEITAYRLERRDVGPLVVEYVNEKIYLLDKRGNLITLEQEVLKKWWFFGPETINFKTTHGIVFPNLLVGEVIRDFWKRANDIQYLLSYYRVTRAVIIYKLPKKVSLKRWFDDQVALERKQFREEIVAIG